MPTRGTDDPLFDLLSYARPGPGRRDRLTPAQLQQIARTVGRTPEVMVKVLSHGAGDLGAVHRHLDYIGRKGDVDLETDDGQTLRGPNVGKGLIYDWDLELDSLRSRTDLISRPGRQAPRLVQKLVFSMPAGTPPEKVLEAVQNFCREEFALKHRYAMALHTDEPHPHVHVVLKAVSEQGKRLYIRKATLREWREGFARHLRAVGIEANASPRHVRSEMTVRKSDGIYRAAERGESTHMRQRAEAAARQLARGQMEVDFGRVKLAETRGKVQRAWGVIGEMLRQEGQAELSARVLRFAECMPLPMTDQELIAAQMVERVRPPRVPDGRSR